MGPGSGQVAPNSLHLHSRLDWRGGKTSEAKETKRTNSQNIRVIRNEKLGGGEAHDLEKFRVGVKVRRAKRLDTSMDSVTGIWDTGRAWRPVCTLVC